MRKPRSPIHTAPPGFGQDVVQAAAAYQATVLRLIRHAMAGDGTAAVDFKHYWSSVTIVTVPR